MGQLAPELHNKYGETVRIAPSKLSYIQPQSYNDILGRPSKKEMIKDPAFAGTKVNGAYTIEPLLVKYCDRMVGKVEEVSKANNGTFNIMAKLLFGKSLNILDTLEYSPWVSIIFEGLKFVSFRGVLSLIPIFGLLLSKLMQPKIEQCTWTDCDKPDFWNFVLRHEEEGKGLTRAEMQTNAVAFMHLTQNPDVMAKVVNEIRTTFKHTDEIALGPSLEMEYLTAVIHEGLRLYAPGGAGVTRIVPEGGAEVLGDYAAYRHASNFAEPTRFALERWIDKNGAKWKNDRRDVYEPLAMLELRLLLSKILYHFDVSLLPECQDWINQKTFIAWQKPALMIKATRVQ
ncbi:cytochrome P450 [Xylariaceae sp. FL0255]|nr:cytochrome P450 [Xylariaceae sp. FL0255]